MMPMNNVQPAKGAAWWWKSLQSRGILKACLWLLNGILVGLLAFSLTSQWREAKRLTQAQTEVVALYNQLMPKVEQQLAGINQMQDDLKNDLLLANAASVASDIKLSLYRSKAKRIKSQFDLVDASLRRLSDEASKTMTKLKLPGDAELVPAEQRQQLEALGRQLDDRTLELNSLESQLDWVALRWSQLVVKEAEAAKQAQVQQVQAAAEEAVRVLSEAQQRTQAQLAEALLRSQVETERTRAETFHRAALDALQRVQTPAPAIPVTPAVYAPPPMYYYGEPISSPYYTGSSYYNRWRCGSFISYGCRRPHYHRFGPYLVID
jgi:hypothetical protein